MSHQAIQALAAAQVELWRYKPKCVQVRLGSL